MACSVPTLTSSPCGLQRPHTDVITLWCPAASLLSTMAYKRLNKCANKTLLECDPRVLFSTAQLLALITHHFFVFVNLLQASDG